MGEGANDSTHDGGGEAEAVHRQGPDSSASAVGPETHNLTYQVIFRHLAKFRDGARSVLAILAANVPEQALTSKSAPADGIITPVHPEPKTPLGLRIDQHMATVDRALVQIRNLSPDRLTKAELPPEIRDQILTKERTIHDIVGAELHFWAAAIENAPLEEFDEIEQKWVRRIIRLATQIGVDAEHKEHLDFLEDWASRQPL
jgi:hypothetical protein